MSLGPPPVLAPLSKDGHKPISSSWMGWFQELYSSLSGTSIGSLSVDHGGTGATTLTGLLRGNGTSAITGGAKASLTAEVTGILPVLNGGTSLSVLGTGIVTALGIAVGGAGGLLVSGGALGTPSSGTLTNASGLTAAGVVGTA